MLCKIWGFSQRWLWRMPSSGMWCHETVVRTEVSELGTKPAVTSNVANVVRRSRILVASTIETIRSSTSVLTRATRRHVPKEGTLQVSIAASQNQAIRSSPTLSITTIFHNTSTRARAIIHANYAMISSFQSCANGKINTVLQTECW
jgi:hypothetical protein